MNKRQYILRLDSKNPEGIDERLEAILLEIRYMKRRRGDDFDFGIVALLDDYIIEHKIGGILTQFLLDIMREDNLFHAIYTGDEFVEGVKQFITSLLDAIDNPPVPFDESYHEMDALIRVKDYGIFSFHFKLPKDALSKDDVNRFIYLGADYMLGSLAISEIFKRVLAPMYLELAERDLLELDSFKDFGEYMYGLH